MLLGWTASRGIGLGQEGAALSFDLIDHGPIVLRLDLLLLIYGTWKMLAWLAGRDGVEPLVAVPTALTGVFLLMPWSVSWFVNQPAMILLGLVGEISPWAATVTVWVTWFGILSLTERIARRNELVQLRIV